MPSEPRFPQHIQDDAIVPTVRSGRPPPEFWFGGPKPCENLEKIREILRIAGKECHLIATP
jgi:hypothetical protein